MTQIGGRRSRAPWKGTDHRDSSQAASSGSAAAGKLEVPHRKDFLIMGVFLSAVSRPLVVHTAAPEPRKFPPLSIVGC